MYQTEWDTLYTKLQDKTFYSFNLFLNLLSPTIRSTLKAIKLMFEVKQNDIPTAEICKKNHGSWLKIILNTN